MEMLTTEKLYDLTKLRQMTGDNEEFLASLAVIYLSTVPSSCIEMLQAAAAKDWLTVSKLAHKIKPTVDGMNIDSITSDIRQLEFDGKKNINTDKLEDIAIKVDKVVNAVALQLRIEYSL